MISELKDNNIDIELYKDDKDFATLENLTNFAITEQESGT